jgi:hypothetical protein
MEQYLSFIVNYLLIITFDVHNLFSLCYRYTIPFVRQYNSLYNNFRSDVSVGNFFIEILGDPEL